MKFLIVDPAFRNNELYFRYKEYVRAIKDISEEVDIISPKNMGQKSKSGLLPLLSVLFQIFKKGNRYDIIIIPTKSLLFLYVFIFKKLFKKKVIIDHISSYVSIREVHKIIPKFLEHWAYAQGDYVVCFTESYREKLISYHNLSKEKVVTLYCAVDDDLFQPKYMDEVVEFKKKNGLDNKFISVDTRNL